MKKLVTRLEGKSLLWVFVLVAGATVLLGIASPHGSRTLEALVGLVVFAALFAVQSISGLALDNWWALRVRRDSQPFSYWWRTTSTGLLAAVFAFYLLAAKPQ